ncbi:MAG: hypothetical protein JOY55_16645 [Mycobacterium sp.]|nr:hypothetical protein [Mycobacterium sp.]MBV8293409.1 hypothetical protein [Mycobacterium sp.]
MGRGLGKTERHVLDTLASLAPPHRPFTTGGDFWYLNELCSESPTRSEVESVRRAVRSLYRKGLVEIYLADGNECIKLAAKLAR